MDVAKVSVPLQPEGGGQAPQRASVPKTETAIQTQDDQKQQTPVSKENLEAAFSALAVRYNLKFEVSHDQQAGVDVVRVFSDGGKQLVRQIPPEAVLKIADGLKRGDRGGLLASLV